MLQRIGLLIALLSSGCGKVGAKCEPTLSSCGGACVDMRSSDANCGSCGNACGTGAHCVSSACVCDSTHATCAGGCADLTSDANNCGACDVACTGGRVCTSGSCECAAGHADCGGGTCADLMTDSMNCGTCANNCLGGSVCESGTCGCSANNYCFGMCSDPMTDSINCGGCGNTCTGGKTCQGGTCQCASPTLESGGVCVCGPGFAACGGGCCPDPTIATRWLHPTGTVDSNNMPLTMTFVSTGIAGTVYQCRTGAQATFSPTTPAWGNCDGGDGSHPTYSPAVGSALPSPGPDDGGSWRTQYRYQAPSLGYTSPVVTYDYYVHNSLNGVPSCTQPFSDLEYFAAARGVPGFDTSAKFPTDGSVDLRVPVIQIPFVGATPTTGMLGGGQFFTGFGKLITLTLSALPNPFNWKTLSLRHIFDMSLDRTMILARRHYQHQTGKYCTDQIKFGGDLAEQAGPVGANRSSQVLSCDAVVVNTKGNGVCLFGPSPNPSATPQVRVVDTALSGLGTAGAGLVTAVSTTSVTISTTTPLPPSPAPGTPIYLRFSSVESKWFTVTGVNAARTVATFSNVADDPVAAGVSLNDTWRYQAVSPQAVVVLPAGFQKLPHDPLTKAGGNLTKTPGLTAGKCTANAACNDTNTALYYLPP